jgi:SAM-dependent methyltransferase
MKRHHERPELPGSVAAYERLSAYSFGRRYTQGKTVADLSHKEEPGGYGSRLLAQSARSLTALSDLPKLALPDGSFDVVVAFGVIEELEHPEELVREAKRVLKEGGVLLVSAKDKRTALADDRGGVDGRRGGMYVPEFRRLLERHFGHVRLYRQGAVAGGLVFPVSGELTGGAAAVPVECVRLSSSGPRLDAEPQTTRSVMAVCTDAAEALGEERAYLLVDRDGRVFDESEERAEDVELLRAEIVRMQETEVQAYLKDMSAQLLPLGELLRLIPQVLLYYLYSKQADFQEASRRSMVLEKARHRWNTSLAETRHRRDVILAKARHRWDTTFVETRHRREVPLDDTRRRRDVALEDARRRRDVTLEDARRRRDVTLEVARHRRDVALEETRRRRDVALQDTRHHRNLILAEIRHRRNVSLEHIIHRRNIIRGNMRVIRQKGPRGLAKGALRRLSALYRRLREGRKP